MQKLSRYMFVLAAFLTLAAALRATAADELKIVYNVGVAPLKFEDPEGRPAGLFPDLWRLWAQKAGKQIEFVRVDSFDQSLQMLKDGEVDLHAGLFKTPEREKFLDYSEELLALDYYIFTHPSVYPIKSLEKTAGLIVGIQKGGYTEGFVRSKVPANRIAVYDRFQDLFRAALEGEIKVFVATELSLLYFLRENFQTNIFEYDRDRPLYSQVYYTATQKGNPALIQQANDGLKAIGSDERKQLENKWIVMDFKDISQAPADTASEKETRIGLSASEKAFLEAHPVIRVHNEKDWPPFNYFEYGTPRGLSIDYMNLLAERLGIKVEYVTGPSWDEFLGMVQHKDLDVMLNIVKTEDRTQYLLFTEPYMKNPNVLVSSQEKPYDSLAALFGKTVAFPEGFFYEEVLTKSFPRIKRLPVENTLASLKAVMFGRAEAAVGKTAVVRTLINKNLLTGLQISGEVNIGDPDLTNLRIGVRDDWPLLHSALMKAMAAVTPQEMNAIRQKWMMVDIEPSAEHAAGSISYGRLALYGLAVFLILSLLAWTLIKTIQRANISVNFGSRWFRRLVLAGLSLFIIIVCLLGLFTLEQNREAILKGIGENLKQTLKTADNRLNLWVAQRTSLLKLLGRDPELVTLTKRLLAVTPDQDNLRASEALQDVRSFFKNNKEFFSNSGFFIINANDATIGSLHDTSLGRPNVISIRKPELIRRAFEGEVLFVPPVQLDDAAVREPQADGAGNPSTKFFMGPILEPNGQILALMALGVDPAKEFSWVLPTSETRKTGETYAFDERGRMLSESRFEDQLRRIGLLADDQKSALNIEIKDPGVNLVKGQRSEIERSQQPLTRMASRAVQLKLDMEKTGQTFGRSKMEIDTKGYRDYRGVPVFGAWLWNAELGLGLATEIGVREAMSPYYQVRRTVFGVLGFTLILSVAAVLLVLILGERTSRALIKARDNLEAKVDERTAELQDKQTQLEAAVERSHLLLDSAGEGIFGVNLEGKAAFINPAANRMLGYESDELIGQKVHEIIHHSQADGSSYPKEKCPMYLSYADGSDHHVTNEVLWRKDGSAFPAEYTSMPIKKDGRVVGAVVTFMDITERMKAEEAVRRNQEQLQVVLESIQAVAFLKDRQGRHLLVNRFYENAVGVKKEDILGRTDLEIFPAEAARQIMALDEEVMSSGKMQTIEEEIPHPDGSLHAYLTTKVPLFDKDGIVYGMCGLATDITDRKRVEETLTRERERLQKILDTSPVGVGISTEGVVRFANPRFAELFYSRKGEAAQDAYVDPKDREYIVQQLKRTGIVRDYELQTYGPNREIRETLATFISTEYEGQSGILAWMVDLSSLKEAEKELRARFDELARFRRLAIGREQKMIELKKEINEILKTNGLPDKYKIH
ncbi:MAG: transporter substrate-binding domain-containing protein [Desulfobacterales bacterium]|nr:MAG: transporter substrate-binding domain-containing protein [Desulfobacterales bacterium]